jgi:hypothetical protein
MYHVIQQKDGTWACEGRLQDSTERWDRPNLASAIQSMIRFARTGNGSIITQKDISVQAYVEEPTRLVTDAQWELLQAIASGSKVVLDKNDKRVRYKLDDEDCETIRRIREGEYVVMEGK